MSHLKRNIKAGFMLMLLSLSLISCSNGSKKAANDLDTENKSSESKKTTNDLETENKSSESKKTTNDLETENKRELDEQAISFKMSVWKYFKDVTIYHDLVIFLKRKILDPDAIVNISELENICRKNLDRDGRMIPIDTFHSKISTKYRNIEVLDRDFNCKIIKPVEIICYKAALFDRGQIFVCDPLDVIQPTQAWDLKTLQKVEPSDYNITTIKDKPIYWHETWDEDDIYRYRPKYNGQFVD